MIDEDTIKNTKDGGWSKGDVLEMVALVFPDDIVGDDDPVVFPPEHQQLLRLVVLLRMYGRANKDMPETTQTLYDTCYTRWLNSSARIVNKKSHPKRGYGQGLNAEKEYRRCRCFKAVQTQPVTFSEGLIRTDDNSILGIQLIL